MPSFTELVDQAPWHEATTYRNTWPHEYVLLQKDGQRELLEEFCRRIRDGDGVPGQFFSHHNLYLFIGNYKYWMMKPVEDINWSEEEVLNRASLYRDRRDFQIQSGDTGRLEDYPTSPPHQL